MLLKNTEMMQDGDNTIFMGPCGSGKTRSMLVTALQRIEFDIQMRQIPEGCEVYGVDPYGDIKVSCQLNLDKLPAEFVENLKLVATVKELPKDMSNAILLIDDGRGYFSLVEHEGHFDRNKGPLRVFSTVQIQRPLNAL